MATDTSHGAATSLLELPDPCLVAVMRCCAVDVASICSAARAHSKLHQLAVELLSSITLKTDSQQRVDSLLLYNHGQQLDSISLTGAVTLRQLPPNLSKLSSLELNRMHLQLRPGGNGHPGVLGAFPPLPLKQLRLNGCRLLDGIMGLAATASLPGLQHLSINSCVSFSRQEVQELTIPGFVMSRLQPLTYLELVGVCVENADRNRHGAANLQHLSGFTRLLDLRLLPANSYRVTTSEQLPAQLTRLVLGGSMGVWLDAAALAGRTLLQHLDLECHGVLNGAAGVAQLLSQVRQMQQLTYLRLEGSSSNDESCPPAAAYAALTASSKLQHLDISKCRVPAGVWQHVLPAGRRLPNLQHLGLSYTRVPAGLAATHASGSLEGLEGVCQLTALRQLRLRGPSDAAEELLLQLTQLQQLSSLDYAGQASDAWGRLWLTFRSKVSTC